MDELSNPTKRIDPLLSGKREATNKFEIGTPIDYVFFNPRNKKIVTNADQPNFSNLNLET